MFIRCQKHSNSLRRTIMICHSFREKGKVRQKILKYIGVAHDDHQFNLLMQVAKTELNSLINNKNLNSECDDCDGVRLADLTEKRRVIEGFHEVFGTLFDRLDVKGGLSKYRYNQLKDVVIARIASPGSKAYTAKMLEKDYQRPITENRIYRMMDAILDNESEIKLKIFEFSKKLCPNQNIDLLFFDVTTLYFESQKADELKNFGYSKDHKIGEVQILLALATTSLGLPIGYTLFPGNIAEVDTLLQCLEEWKKIFTIGEITIIADRAMMSEDNLKKMEESHLNYVVAAKLKSLPEKLKQTILERKRESCIELQEETIKAAEHEYKGRRLIVSFSESRAKKDRGDRERLLSKLKTKLGKTYQANPKKLITNRGYLKFVNDNDKGNVILNEEKIAQDVLWDGLHGVITSNREISAQEALRQYRRLWIIEESFKINKSTLAMRPIYHFSPKRIKAHILICYIAFALSRYAQFQICAFTEGFSIEKIRDELLHVQATIIENELTGKLYKLPSNMSKEAKKIYQSFAISRNRYPKKWIIGEKCSVLKKT